MQIANILDLFAVLPHCHEVGTLDVHKAHKRTIDMNMARKFSVTCCLLSAFSILSAIVATPLVSAQDTSAPRNPVWTTPEVGALPDDEQGRLVRRGRDLVTATYAHIGPEVPDIANRYAGNNLACSNCHLQAGTKKFGLPLFGLFGEFPQYSARSGLEITIEE